MKVKGKPKERKAGGCQIQSNLLFVSEVLLCGFIKQIKFINKICRERETWLFFLAQKWFLPGNTRGLFKYFDLHRRRSFCLLEPDFLIFCRWTGLSPWKKKGFRPEIGKCPTSPRKARKARSVLRNYPSACKRSPLHSVLPPLPVTWLLWGTCPLSATLDTSCQHLPPFTHLPASPLDIHIPPAWSRLWDRIRRSKDT